MDERSGSVHGTPASGKIPYKRPLATRSSPYSKPASTTPPQRSPLSSLFAAPINYVYQVASKWTSPLASAPTGTNGLDVMAAPAAAPAAESPAVQAYNRTAENGSQVGVAEQQDMQLDRPESSDQVDTSIAERIMEACRKDGLGEDKLQAVSSILQGSTPVAGSSGRHTVAWGQAAKSTQPAFTTTRLSPLQSMSAVLAAQSFQPPPSRSALHSRPPSAGRAAAPRFSPSSGSMFQEKLPTPFPSRNQMPAFSTGRFAKPDRTQNRSKMAPMRTPTHLRSLGTAVRPQGADSDLTGSAFDGAPSISQPSSPRGTSIPTERGARARGVGRPAAVSWTPMRNITRAQLPSGQNQRPAAVGLKRGAQDMAAVGGTSYAGTHTRVVRPRIESRPASRGGQGSGSPPPLTLSAPAGLITAPAASPPARPPAAPGAVPLPATETARRLAAALDMLPSAKPPESSRFSSLPRSSEPAILPPPPPTDSLGPSASPLRSPSTASAAVASVSAALPPAAIPSSRPSVTFAASPDLPQAFKSLVPQATRAPTPYPHPTSQAQAPIIAATPGAATLSLPRHDPETSPPRAKQLDFASPTPAASTPNPSSPGSPMFPLPKASSPPITPPPASGAALFSFNPPSSSGSPTTPSLPAKGSSGPSSAVSSGILPGRTITSEAATTTAAAVGSRFGNGSLAAAASNGGPSHGFGARGGDAGTSSSMFASNGPVSTLQSRGDGAKSDRTFKFGGKRDSKLDEVLRGAELKYPGNGGVDRAFQFGAKRIRTADGSAATSQPPLPSPTVTTKQQLDAKATLAVAATVPLPSDSDDEGPSPPPAKPAPEAGGWDLAFLQKSQATMAAANKAVSEEIDKAKGGASAAPKAGSFTFGAASSAPAASTAAAASLFKGTSTPSVPLSSAAATPSIPVASAAPAAPAPATGGWGADLLAKASAGLSKASTAAAEEIEQKKGGAGASQPAAATNPPSASSQDTGLLSFLGSTAASSSSLTFGTSPPAPAPSSSFSFGDATTTSAIPPTSSFSFGATAAATTAASSAAFGAGISAPASTAFGGFPSVSASTTAVGAEASQPSAGFSFGASSMPNERTPNVSDGKAEGFGGNGGAFGFGSSTPAFGASGNGPTTTSTSGGFSFGVTASKVNADGGNDTPPAIGFGASSASALSNGPSAGAMQPSSGFSFGSTPPAPSSSPTMPFASTTFPPPSFGTSAPTSQPDTLTAPSNGASFGFGSTSGSAFGGASTSPSSFSSGVANGFSMGSAPPAAGSSLFGAEPGAASGAALFGGANSGSDSLFGAGAAQGAGAPPTSSFTFGSNPGASSFSAPTPAPTFGTTPAPTFGAPAPAPASTFAFGGNAPAPAAAPAPAPSGFTFGSSAPAAPAFGAFGGAAPGPVADSAPGFSLGTAGEAPARRRIVKARRRG